MDTKLIIGVVVGIFAVAAILVNMSKVGGAATTKCLFDPSVGSCSGRISADGTVNIKVNFNSPLSGSVYFGNDVTIQHCTIDAEGNRDCESSSSYCSIVSSSPSDGIFKCKALNKGEYYLVSFSIHRMGIDVLSGWSCVGPMGRVDCVQTGVLLQKAE
ncbi:MAG: hypothetical protein ACPLYC_00905 [Minisyncoccia bacterium]